MRDRYVACRRPGCSSASRSKLPRVERLGARSAQIKAASSNTPTHENTMRVLVMIPSHAFGKTFGARHSARGAVSLSEEPCLRMRHRSEGKESLPTPELADAKQQP